MTASRNDDDQYRHFMVTQQDFNDFAQLSGDHNPIHVSPDFAARTSFGRTVAHGMMLFSLLRGELMRRLPGHRLQEQSLMFPAPAFADETLTLELTPSPEDPLRFSAAMTRADGECVLTGECVLRPTSPEELP